MCFLDLTFNIKAHMLLKFCAHIYNNNILKHSVSNRTAIYKLSSNNANITTFCCIHSVTRLVIKRWGGAGHGWIQDVPIRMLKKIPTFNITIASQETVISKVAYEVLVIGKYITVAFINRHYKYLFQ